jgi:hypothetical protein
VTFTVTFTVRRDGRLRPCKTNIAGCQDAAAAERKLYELYVDVVTVKRVEPAGLSQDLVGRS